MNRLNEAKKNKEQYWEKEKEYPKRSYKELKTRFDWEEYLLDFKEKWYDYIDNEFTRREEGFYFYNNGIPLLTLLVLIICTCNGQRFDVGAPDYRESNRLFFIFWEACKADTDVTECAILKTDDLDFHFMSQAEGFVIKLQYLLTLVWYTFKSGADAKKKMFTDKVVPNIR